MGLILLISISILFHFTVTASRSHTRQQIPHQIAFLKQIHQSHKQGVTSLTSIRNFWGLPEAVGFPDGGGFNPALLSIPSDGHGTSDTLVVAREEDPTLWQDNPVIRPRWIIAGLLNLSQPDEDARDRFRWSLTESTNNPCTSVHRLPKLVHTENTLLPKCDHDVWPDIWFRNVQGPEDPRLFWSHLGEPLLIYNSISADNNNLCRHMYLVDVRSALPETMLHGLWFDPKVPIRFADSVPLLYEHQRGFQKNWVPFTNDEGELFIHTDLIPQTIYRLRDSVSYPNFHSHPNELNCLDLAINGTADTPNCLTGAMNKPLSDDFRVHQSTPFLDLVLCTLPEVVSGRCDPNDHRNRLYIGLIHVVHPGKLYERRIITLNSTRPWNYVSVSRPVAYGIFRIRMP